MKKSIFFLLPFVFLVFWSCKIAANQVSLEEKKETRKKWVFMVYMAADNELESYGIQDINEMEAAIDDKGDIAVYVLCDRNPSYDGTNKNWSDTRLFEIRHDREGLNGTIVSGEIECPELDLYQNEKSELDMGNPYVLSSFISSIQKKVSADNYGLVIWGHGSGWRGYSVDDSSGTSLSLPDIRESLGGKKLDFLFFDTCFGLTLETLYELKDAATCIIGTPGINPVTGLDYEKFLTRFSETQMTENDVSLCIAGSSEVPFYGFHKDEIEDLFDSFNLMSGYIAETIESEEIRKNTDSKFKNQVLGYHSTSYPCDLFVEIGSTADFFMEVERDKTESPCTEIKNILNSRKLSVHYVPLIASNVTASTHSGLYWHEKGDSESNEKCRFVKEAGNWVPGNDKKSLLDKLFYTSF